MSVKLRTREQAKKRTRFYLDIYINGSRSYETLDISYLPNDKDKKEKKELAEITRDKRALEISSQEYGVIPKHKKKVDFIEYFQRYIDNCTKADKRIFRYSLEKFKTFYTSSKLPSNKLNHNLIKGYKDYLESSQSGLTGETPYDYFQRFKRVLKQAYKDGLVSIKLIEEASELSIKRRNNQLKKEILTSNELTELKNTYCGNEEVKKAFLFACFTGLGEAEIRKLTWSRILPENKIKLFREKSGEQVINNLHNSALGLLGDRGGAEKPVFNLPSNVAVSKNLKNWIKKAEIEKSISFYCARHSFACMLLINGANLKTVADCLGHSDTKHTLKYLNYVNELKDEAINNLPPL